MTTTVKERRRTAALLSGALAIVIAGLLAAWLVMAIWIKGGPQPVHTIVIALPAPQIPARAGPHA